MASEPRTLVVLAHPQLADSRVNTALADAARSVAGVTVHDLYATYPDARIDIAHEQGLLRAHDRVVLQFPFYWYAAPPLLKQWLDEVLVYGFAYGSEGSALRDKSLRVATSVGGPRDSYGPEGVHRHSVPDLLRPFDATAGATSMRYEEPFVAYGTRRMDEAGLAAQQDAYRTLLQASPSQGASHIAPAAAEESSLAA
ncbi:NAD(P)H-dependent oxidoreductase [Streptomyces sp. NPDC057702]|uniref:NAD(P)H-dependent oxidoreductase n=1 Tax=unclassified Streptomyces TaxID=2593676 RepID=UPI0036AF6C27